MIKEFPAFKIECFRCREYGFKHDILFKLYLTVNGQEYGLRARMNQYDYDINFLRKEKLLRNAVYGFIIKKYKYLFESILTKTN